MNIKEKYIVGLGNPGKEYTNNRHNVGFLILEILSKKYNSKFTLKNKLKCWSSEIIVDSISYKLFLPKTFMNNSGDAVKAIVDWYKIDYDQLYILVDDIDLPLGKIRFRKKGGSGGHNGLKSIIEKLQTQTFNRIRVGVGSPHSIKKEKDFNTISFVLGNISPGEKKVLDKVYEQIIESLELLNTQREELVISKLNSFKLDDI